MAEGLQIQIGANVSNAVAGLNKVQSELDQTAASSVKVSGAVNQAATSLNRLPTSASQATTAVGNLSRIVQDAPFGFIAISNNLQPLFDDFQRLKAQTGSVGGAFKGLLGAIAGPAGIGLAFAAATSLVTYFSREIFGSGAAAKKAKDDIAEFNKSLDSAKASALSSGLQLQKFVEIAKNSTLPLEQRNEALKNANDILGEYGQKLTLTNVATAQATELVNSYTQGLIAQALANQLADRAATLLINQANAQKAVTEAQLQYNRAQAAFINRPQLSLREQELGRGQAFIIDRDNALKSLNDRQKEYAAITKEITNITTLFNEQALKSTNLLGKAGTKVKGKVDIELEPIFTISKLTIEIAKQADQFAKDNLYTEQYQKEIQEGFKDLKPVKIPFKIPAEVDFQKKEFENTKKENEKKLEDFVNNINKTLQGIQVEGITALAQGLGKVFAGGDIGEAFKAFGDVIANGLESLGKQLISIGALAKLTKESLTKLFTNPTLAIAVGIGLIAAGSALRTSLSKGVGARALGGPVSGGNPYLVGERGPELFVPSVSGGIVPNNSVGSFMSGRMGDSGRGTTLRGQDIILAYARTQRSQLRVNG